MLGLIKKDLLMTKGNVKVIFIMFIAFGILAINGESNLTFLPAFISIMIMITTFSYDEYNKTYAYITTFPNGRKNVVRAKYLATLLVIFVAVILTLIVSLSLGYMNNNMNIEYILETTEGCACAIIIMQAILYPLIFKFGIEKSRIGMFIGVFGISGAIAVLAKNGVSLNIPENVIAFLNNYWMIIIPIVLVLVLWGSYKLSEYLYLKKEF